MSQKKRDKKNRWRNKIVAFRMSPEEAAQLDVFVRLSGLTKQDYLIGRVLQRDIVVHGNSRIYKALRDQLREVLTQLKRIEAYSAENEELLEQIQFITQILHGFKEGV